MKWKKSLSARFINTILVAACAASLLLFSTALNAEKKKELFNLGDYLKGMFVGEDLDPKFGTYEEIVLSAAIFPGDPRHTDMKKMAVEKVIYRFINKQSALSQYPGKAIEGIVWLEVLYNEMIKHPKATRPSAIRDIWQAREDIRKSMGFHKVESTQEVVDRYVLLSSLLANAEVTEQAIDPNLKKRKDIYKNLKSNISRAKKNYLGELDDDELALLEKKSLKNIDDSPGTPSSTKETESTTSGDTPEEPTLDQATIREKLIQLKGFYDDGLISEEDYETKKQELLDAM